MSSASRAISPVMVITVKTPYLDPAGEGTLQHQIQQMVIEGILSGRYRPGERMPSSRKLAEHLGVSRITVTLAYTELVSNDYLTSRGRSGYYISESAPQPALFTAPAAAQGDGVDWSRALGQRFAGEPTLERPENWRDFPYPFIYGQADPRLFDHQNWRLCALQALGQKDFVALTADYYTGDDPKLVEFITRHILPRRGIFVRPEQVLLTLGAQNALWLTAQILLNQRRTAAIENPCYPGLREILNQSRCATVALDVDEGGLPAENLPDAIDAVFTTPSHHAPTNATMPIARRRALLKRASEQGFIVVEDDYEFEMAFARSPLPALKSLDTEGRVVYIGSFSKSLFPGMRLGYLVGSEPFIREARALRATVLRHPPGHIQRTAAYFLSLGHYDAQVNRMGRAFRRRRALMDAAIREHGLEMAGSTAHGGSSFWMKTPNGVNATALSLRLREKGVLIEPGRAFFGPDDDNDAFYRLAYSSIPEARIGEGIARIAAALR